MSAHLKFGGILLILMMALPIGCNDVSLPEQAKTKPAECAKESKLTDSKKKFKSVRLALADDEESESEEESEENNDEDKEADKDRDKKEDKDDDEDKDEDKAKAKKKDCSELTDGESGS